MLFSRSPTAPGTKYHRFQHIGIFCIEDTMAPFSVFSQEQVLALSGTPLDPCMVSAAVVRNWPMATEFLLVRRRRLAKGRVLDSTGRFARRSAGQLDGQYWQTSFVTPAEAMEATSSDVRHAIVRGGVAIQVARSHRSSPIIRHAMCSPYAWTVEELTPPTVDTPNGVVSGPVSRYTYLFKHRGIWDRPGFDVTEAERQTGSWTCWETLFRSPPGIGLLVRTIQKELRIGEP